MNIESQVLQINIDDIIPNRFQPRLAFDEQGLKELSDSIKEHGIIQPLVLRKLGNKYEIIAGERRYKAATMAGLVSVPAVISNIDDNKSAEVALVENVQRRDLSAVEEARSYKALLDKGYLTQEQLAKKMGLSQPAIANKLRLLNLDEEVQQALMNEKISERHARALLTVDDKEKQRFWLQRIINERLTVRQLDIELKKEKAEDLNGEVPLVEAMPNIDDIKSKAQDIIPNKDRRSVASMMVPEDIMTEFSGALPSDVVENEPKVEEQQVNFNDEILPQPENKFFNFDPVPAANMDTGISMEPTPESVFQINPEPATPQVESESLETLDLFPAESVNNTVPTMQLLGEDAVDIIKDTINNLKHNGYNIDIEELDIGDKTQLIVKIDK